MAEPKEVIKIAKATILGVAPGPLWGLRDEPKDRPSHILTIQDAADTTKVYNVKCSQKDLPENIKQGAVVDNLEFGMFEWGDQQEHRIKFEKPGGGKFGGGGGYRGISPEELQLKKDELQLRRDQLLVQIISTNTSYSKDIVIAGTTGEVTPQLVADGAKVLIQFTFDEIRDRKG